MDDRREYYKRRHERLKQDPAYVEGRRKVARAHMRLKRAGLWTPQVKKVDDRFESIRKEYRQGCTIEQLSKKYDLHPSKIYAVNWISELIPDRLPKFLKFYEEGLTLEQIGARFSLTRERVRQILSRSERYYEIKDERMKRNREKVMMTLVCERCHSVFEGHTKRKFCSRKCSGAALKEKAFQRRRDPADSSKLLCNSCKEYKSESEFYHVSGRSWLFTGGCKKCRSKVSIDWAKRNPEKAKESLRKAKVKYWQKVMSDPILKKKKYDEQKKRRLALCQTEVYKQGVRDRSRRYIEKLKSTDEGRLKLKLAHQRKYSKHLDRMSKDPEYARRIRERRHKWYERRKQKKLLTFTNKTS